MAKIRICPKCRKPKLREATNIGGWLAPDMFECLECGYVGSFYIEIDPNDYQVDNSSDELEENTKK